MATTLPTARPSMTLLGAAIRALGVGGSVQVAAASSGDHAIVASLITAGGALLAVVLGPLLRDVRGRHRDRTLARRDAEIRRLRRENERLKRNDRDR